MQPNSLMLIFRTFKDSCFKIDLGKCRCHSLPAIQFFLVLVACLAPPLNNSQKFAPLPLSSSSHLFEIYISVSVQTTINTVSCRATLKVTQSSCVHVSGQQSHSHKLKDAK